MSADASRWSQVKALFESLLERPAAEQESLIAAANLNGAMEAELRTLLRHHEQVNADVTGGRFLDQPAVPPAPPAPPLAALLGQRLGAWEIVRRLGEGGMGEVFEARRADGSYEGRAAVKLLKRGMDSTAVLQRFAQERNALARLSHPHISRLLDAGANEEGLPYFVMEYVDGRPIHEAALGLPLEQRLQLFLQLADAVAHAHRNLLVHRDLKPGNVLVDGEGQVKLLDFGIAKALDPLEGTDPGVTQQGERPYTPHYASPEQVRGEPVTTATDIYSLGVLLYQMLTGARPTGRAATTAAEAVKGVLEEQPTRPSRLSARDALDPRWIDTRKRLEGDLDHILLMALEKPIERRYASVDALSADIERYLQARPVAARAASPLYVLDKFVRRNRWAVLAGVVGGIGLVSGLAATLLQGRVAAALGVLGLAGGLGMALLQAQRAAAARDRAQAHLAEARAIASDVMVRHADAVHFLPGGATLKVQLLQNMIGHLDRLANQAGNDAAFSGELAMAYSRLAHLQSDQLLMAMDQPQDADAHALRSLPLFQAGEPVHGGNPHYGIWWARAWRTRAMAARHRGDAAAALEGFEQMAAVVERALLRHPRDGQLLSELGSAHLGRGQVFNTWSMANLQRPGDALAAFAQADALYQGLVDEGRASNEDLHQLGTIAGARMMVCFDQGRVDEAVAHGERAVQVRQVNVERDPDHVAYRNGLATEANNLGYVLLQAGRPEQALAYARLSQEQLLALEAADPGFQGWRDNRILGSLHLARALLGVGQTEQALPLLEELVQHTAAAGTVRAAWGRLELAGTCERLGRAACARLHADAAWSVLAGAAAAAPEDTHVAGLLARCRALLEGLDGA
jgi:serine/threonine protein kinase